MAEAIHKDSKIYIAGHRGIIGTALVDALRARLYHNLVYRTHDELDLTIQADVELFFKRNVPTACC